MALKKPLGNVIYIVSSLQNNAYMALSLRGKMSFYTDYLLKLWGDVFICIMQNHEIHLSN